MLYFLNKGNKPTRIFSDEFLTGCEMQETGFPYPIFFHLFPQKRELYDRSFYLCNSQQAHEKVKKL
ncbi:MAG: hypothetical protein DRI88_08550 [Bacteroidetes bacterium]|nr:MAG: hypothetical protein DRI72_01210 [Bacteroidota bacterium]RLD45639.1 MAG: hypothetical protein DRI88_08550 [Bacteroidota bacterium]RLD70353.1 MAG: hypothetical protein DRI87_08470 [Bacteroidota bacterium]RLD87123.1 MAG: hypothetical protein DRJ02_07145 [Bacteroidota bacterium]